MGFLYFTNIKMIMKNKEGWVKENSLAKKQNSDKIAIPNHILRR